MNGPEAEGLLPARADEAPSSPGVERLALLCMVLCGGTLFWLAPRPPMGDLPQHAGQVALLHDLLTGTSRWSDIVHISYFTPYVLGYSIAVALSFLLPVVTAIKVLLTLTYWAFVAAAVALRRELGGDPRLDWMLPPVFFGFSFYYGFLNFLVAAPVGLLFLLLAKRYAEQRAAGRGGRGAAVRLVALGLLLYYSHGLTFAFGVVTGACMAVVKVERRRAIGALIPYAVLGLVAVTYAVALHLHDPQIAHGRSRTHFQWAGGHRAFDFLAYVMATRSRDVALFGAVLLWIAAPWALGCRPSRDRVALVPLAAVVAFWLFVPSSAAEIDYIYQRFSLFLIPAYAVAFRAPQADPSPARARAVHGGLALLCAALIAAVAIRQRRFADESGSFEAVLAAAEPGERALGMVFDANSPATDFVWAYHAYPLWYQADRKGFVDFNFAYCHPEVVRFRPERTPPMKEDVGGTLKWHEMNASIYRYFFVRHTKPLPADLFENDQCEVGLVRAEGGWALYERRGCRY
jgi:hypothetical protein